MNTTAILELLNEQSSSRIFPEVKDHLQGKIQKFIFDPAQKIDFTRKVEVSGSHIHIPKNMDILYGMEISGSLQIGEIFYDKPEDIIKSIYLVIGGQNIATFFLQNKMCDISVRDNCFSITIKFDKLFYNQEFLPIIGLVYHDIKIVINGLHQDYQCFLHCAMVQEYRKEIATMNHNILMKDCIKYNGEITGYKLFINNGDGIDLMSRTSFINSLYFKFNKNIRDILRSITIKTGDEKTITILSNNDLQFLTSNEFIMEKFHYKTFLYNSIILEFEMTEKFNKISFELITTNYNSLMIHSGMGGMRFSGFRREITCSVQEDEFLEISNELYEEKVVPKNNLICGISYEEFQENEERIISGCCFSSFKRNAVMDWFNIKKKKVCPYCRNENSVWYFKKISI
jgi:hypothetical protein